MRVINFLAEKYYKIAYDTFFYIEDNQKAQKYLSRALEIEPWHKKALRLKGNMLVIQDKIAQALEVWQKLYELGEDDFEVTSKIAYCCAQKGDYKKAFDFCEKSAMQVELVESEKMYSLYCLKIDLLLDTKKPKSAYKLFKNALKMLASNEAYELKNSYSFLNFYTGTVTNLKNVKRAF